MNRYLALNPGVILFCLVTAVTAPCQNIIQFVQNGAWCWFQDERAVVDTAKEKLIIGSANTNSGVDLTIYDLKTNKVESKKTFGRLEYTDDHNSPGICIAPDGNYVAIWAHHYDKYNSRYSIYNGSSWSNEATFNWNNIPGGTNFTIAYSNVYYLSKEKRMFNFARANERAPNFLFSDDNGKTWKFGGQLTTNSSSSYNKGYYKYWSNGVDRIDMCFTEEHPRDQKTSIYHGYILGGTTYNTEGKVADQDIYERNKIPTFADFTKVFAHGTKVNGATMGRCWQTDIMRYDDGTIAILFQARANDNQNDHRNFYARYNGTAWKTTYLGKAGGPMYSSEQDYTGLSALCPNDPDRIYISSPFNPGDDASAAKKREIWRGTTSDNGATWKFEAVTSNSSLDNFRPIVPLWKPGKEALLWWRGSYTSAQNFNANVVGIISEYTVGSSGNSRRSSLVKPAVSIIPGTPESGLITVQYTVPKAASVTLELFSASGKKVVTLTGETVAAGSHQTAFNIGRHPAGVYFCKVTAGMQSKIITVSIVG
jgi:hypothetical protein